MENQIGDAGSIQTAISAHQNLSDLPNIENDDNNDNLSSQKNPKNNSVHIGSDIISESSLKNHDQNRHQILKDSLSTQNIKLEIINSDLINKIKFPSELDPDPRGLGKHCTSKDTLLIKRCKSVDSLRSIESCESETHSDTSQLKSAVKRSKSHKTKSPKDTNEKIILKKKTGSKTQIKSEFATRSIEYIQQNLGGKIFSGWIEERRWIDSIRGYRDVVQVDEWEIEMNHQIKDITNSIPGVAEGTKWINITGPSESEPCCCLWVLMPTAPTPGHCWFQVTNILIEPLFGLRIQLRMIRNLHTHDGETMDARTRRRELLAKQGTSEAVAQGFSQQVELWVNQIRSTDVKALLASVAKTILSFYNIKESISTMSLIPVSEGEDKSNKYKENNGFSNIKAMSNDLEDNMVTIHSVSKNPSSDNLNQTASTSCSKMNVLDWLSCRITKGLENMFEAHGRRVARHPYKAALICTIVSLLCCLGNIKFAIELRPFKLWLPQDSNFIKVLDWQSDNFPVDYRFHTAVWESDNILTAQTIQEMWRTHQLVQELVVPGSNITWNDVCAKIPTLVEYGSTAMDEDMSLILTRKAYCNIVSDLPRTCFESSLLEVWGLNNEVIMNLTDDKVVNDINKITLSAVYGYQRDFISMLGGTEKDSDGKIISAKAAKQMWVTTLDHEAIALGDAGIDEGTGGMVDSSGLLFESAWVNTVLKDTGRDSNIKLYGQAASSFGKVSGDNIYGDVKWLALGFSLMFAFVNMTLGRRNYVEQRPLLSLFGLLSCGFAIGISYGICSAFNVLYCPVNSILPILLIGLGVDDMFVILAAWEMESKNKPCDSDLVERAAKTMKHAGVAITVTSLTDVTAFIVGASTDLPALRSFCIYASVGIFAIYVLQATFFLAWLIKDEQRMIEHKHGLVWFYKLENWTPYSCSQRDLLNEFFVKFYSKILMKTPVRVIVLIISAFFVGSSVWVTSNLHQEFNPMDFIPSSSYVYKWFNASTAHYPTNGELGYIYFENAQLPEDLPALYKLVNDLEQSSAVMSVTAWFTDYKSYFNQHPHFPDTINNETTLLDTLSLFLSSSYGEIYKTDINFNGEQVDCSKPLPVFTTFRIRFIHNPASYPAKQLEVMTKVNSIVDESPIHGSKYIWSQAYSIWETNQIIGFELYRNLILAGVVIAIITLLLLASFWCSMLVLTCVAFTIVGVSGVMWVWGLTIDTVSCIAIVLSIGLSVDYCAHISHAFLAARGHKSRVERVQQALNQVGPAVTNGAFSTFLAFALLGMSTSHVFITFFKVFTPATILGYFYGIVFLPVALSFIGPLSYANEEDNLTVDKQQKQKNNSV